MPNQISWLAGTSVLPSLCRRSKWLLWAGMLPSDPHSCLCLWIRFPRTSFTQQTTPLLFLLTTKRRVAVVVADHNSCWCCCSQLLLHWADAPAVVLERIVYSGANQLQSGILVQGCRSCGQIAACRGGCSSLSRRIALVTMTLSTYALMFKAMRPWAHFVSNVPPSFIAWDPSLMRFSPHM